MPPSARPKGHNASRAESSAGNRKRSAAVAVALFTTAAALAFALVGALRGAGAARPTSSARPAVRAEGIAISDWLPPPTDTPAAFSGKVTDERGEPIAGARVCAGCATCRIHEQPPPICALTDAAGSYALHVETMQSILLSATAAGFAEGRANDGLPLPRDGEPRGGLDIRLQSRGARLAGIVSDALGGPVASARVRLTRLEGAAQSVTETHTDVDGSFALWTTPGPVTLRADADGYAAAVAARVAPSDDVALQLIPASEIRGVVVQHGTDVPVAGVEVQPLLGGVPRGAPAVSGADGSFVLRGLEPGRYVLSAEAEHWRGWSFTPLELGLTASREGVRVEVVAGVRVLGHLEVGREGTPCRQGYVGLGPAPDGAETAPVPGLIAPVEADGTVRFRGLTSGRYQVRLECVGAVLAQGPASIDVADRDLEVRWRLSAGLGMRIQVVDGLGKSVAGAPLLVQGSSASAADALGRAIALESDREGFALIPANLREGTYTVRPLQTAIADAVSVELRNGDGTKAVTVKLAGAAQILVDARDAAGRPVDGLHVRARSTAPAGELRGAMSQGAVPLGQGQYRLSALAAGTYELEALDGVNAPFAPEPARQVSVGEGASASVHIPLRRTASLRGRVVDEKGAPVESAWVRAGQQDRDPGAAVAFLSSAPAGAMTDDEGRFELGGLTAGAEYALTAEQPFGAVASVRGITPGRDVSLVLPSAASPEGDREGREQTRESAAALDVRSAR